MVPPDGGRWPIVIALRDAGVCAPIAMNILELVDLAKADFVSGGGCGRRALGHMQPIGCR